MKTAWTSVVWSAALFVGATSTVSAKTAAECAAEYNINKAKIEGVQSQPGFMAACQAGQEPVAGATSVARPAVPPSTAARQPATPASAAGQAPSP